jgi:hypothetical protein
MLHNAKQSDKITGIENSLINLAKQGRNVFWWEV